MSKMQCILVILQHGRVNFCHYILKSMYNAMRVDQGYNQIKNTYQEVNFLTHFETTVSLLYVWPVQGCLGYRLGQSDT